MGKFVLRSNQKKEPIYYSPQIRNRCSVPMLVVNLQPAPPLPPDNIINDHDRQLQINYEQWLTSQEASLAGKLKYYHEEVTKLRKSRKSLNTKQRGLKKTGNDLTPNETIELNQVTNDQTIVQKQLENARKQSRQHSNLIQEYRNKQQSKLQTQMITSTGPTGTSPAQITPPSPLMSPSPSSSTQQSMMLSAQSPINNPMMQPSCSPLQSPSPMSHSPGPVNNVILQSPNNQANAGMSPYSSMQPSPRTHTQDESPFSPSVVGYVTD